MKQLLLAMLLCLVPLLAARAQTWHNPLPIDSTTHRVTYTGVVEVPGATKAELYSRAREWFAKSFTSAKAVLEMDDKESGKLLGNANAEIVVDFGALLGITPITLWRTIKVEVKDNRYRYTINNFATGNSSGTQAGATNAEVWFKPAMFDKHGEPKRATATVIAGIQQSGESQAASLKAAMAKRGDDF